MEIILAPEHPEVEAAIAMLSQSLGLNHDAPLTLSVSGRNLRINRATQAELHSALVALLIGVSCDYPVASIGPAPIP